MSRPYAYLGFGQVMDAIKDHKANSIQFPFNCQYHGRNHIVNIIYDDGKNSHYHRGYRLEIETGRVYKDGDDVQWLDGDPSGDDSHDKYGTIMVDSVSRRSVKQKRLSETKLWEKKFSRLFHSLYRISKDTFWEAMKRLKSASAYGAEYVDYHNLDEFDDAMDTVIRYLKHEHKYTQKIADTINAIDNDIWNDSEFGFIDHMNEFASEVE